MCDVLFAAFSHREDALDLARNVGARLDERGVTTALVLLDGTETPTFDAHTIVVSLGGDGTFLKSARLAHHGGARVVAVNLGQVGFLLDVPSTEVLDYVTEALASDDVTNRLALEISSDGWPTSEFALNEVVVERASAGHMVRVKTYVDDEEYLTYSADGVLVATPTGSTGYNLSAGGPVVDASLSLLILTPIAPHFTIDRSIVVPDDSIIRLIVENKPAVLVADGRTIGALEPGQAIEVRQNSSPVRVVATGRFDLATRLRRSLRAGHA